MVLYFKEDDKEEKQSRQARKGMDEGIDEDTEGKEAGQEDQTKDDKRMVMMKITAMVYSIIWLKNCIICIFIFIFMVTMKLELNALPSSFIIQALGLPHFISIVTLIATHFTLLIMVIWSVIQSLKAAFVFSVHQNICKTLFWLLTIYNV
uniref:Uncharacterized protein n=1 Tax=Tetranychus urticae TaxID=32264 RepID=T1K4L7_TETUR